MDFSTSETDVLQLLSRRKVLKKTFFQLAFAEQIY